MHRFRIPFVVFAVLMVSALGGSARPSVAAQVATPETPPKPGPVAFLWESAGDPQQPLADPWFLCLDPAGQLWVVDGRNNQFQIIAPDGTFVDAWGTAGTKKGAFAFVEHGACAFDAAGNLYVVDTGNHRIQTFAPDRALLTAWGSEGSGKGQFLSPLDIAVAPDGRVYVIDEQRNDIQVFDGEGQFLFAFGDEGREDGQLLDTGD